MEKILLIEDDDSLRSVIETLLGAEGYAVDAASSAEEAIERVQRSAYSLVVSDYRLPNLSGIEFLKRFREFSQATPVLIMTAFGSIEIAVEAMKFGANDFITKPFEPQRLLGAVRDMLKFRRIVDRGTGSRSRRPRSFLGEHPLVHQVLNQARKVARVDSPVLITGESGAGKELVARYVHEQSPRRERPFVPVNCAAMPAELLESEFFGHEAGAFTGATQTRKGIFEVAGDGTVFLDEVAEMPPALQVKLLRALQEGEIRRVGGNAPIKVSPRIVSATNRAIEEALRAGTLREDFYYRIAVVTIVIPPLRERQSDIKLLTDYYVQYFCNAVGKSPLTIDETARDMLSSYPWPGNARELENVIERAVILADKEILPEHLGIHVRLDLDAIKESAATLTEIGSEAARRAEIDVIQRMLKRTDGNKVQAAKLLGVSYKTLLNKIRDYQLQSQGV